MQHPDYPHGAQLLWSRAYNNVAAWDEVSTWSLEFFGLPGDRYVTEINIHEMIWWFRDPRDQTLFVLRNGQARCIELQSCT